MIFEDREIIIKGEFVSCTQCAVCYDHEMKPTYCQYFNTIVDETEIEKNHKKARWCKEFCPSELPRRMRVSYERSGWQLTDEEKMNDERSKKLKELL